MAVVLYDLVGRDDRRFSPNCWRTRMALAHKGLDCEARPTRFAEIARIAGGEFKSVPVIEDRGRAIGDSRAIAQYLEEAYPDRPSLFGGPGGEALSRFVEHWCVLVLHLGLFGLILVDIHDHLMPEDQEYFRSSRERRFGRTLEEVQAGREERLEGFRRSLQPLRMTLEEAPFLGGAAPLYADYLAFGAFQWARVGSRLRILQADDPVHAWFERCLDLHGGLGRKEPGYW